LNVTEARTLWQDQDGVLSGGSGIVRAAAFPVGDGIRVGVTLTIRVPDDFFRPVDGGGASATLLLNPDEARGFATWLNAAANAADAAGPPLYA
jgi:hypothetical protein